ncbi:solute carrier family 35 member G1 [Brachionus plicatilis]|uniref:Solute carrier family 35 member G1 n=1 Tax=Brachionus plicatilis TaxID=10195 RepID=A0A3M7R2I3_BRAPC|nr:solute carrier family 35 member G1 [Brachionus plicatilis]
MESNAKNQFVNSIFTMDNNQKSNDVKPNSSETITLKTISLNTLPVNSTEELNQSKCNQLTNKLGIKSAHLSKFYSLSLALVSSIAITCSIFMVKLSNVLSASDIGIIKFAVQIIFSIPIAYFYHQDMFGPKGSRLWLVLRGLVGASSIMAAYFSIRLINFEDSMVIRYSSPIITAIFARIILKDRLSMMHFISFGLSFLGIICVIRPSLIFQRFGQSQQVENSIEFILGISLSIFSAMTAGSTFVFIKKLTNKKIHFIVLIFYFSLFGFLISSGISLILYLTKITHHNLMYTKEVILRDTVIGLLSGMISFIGHVCFSLAIARETANKIAVLRTIDILVAFLLEYLVLNVMPHWITKNENGLEINQIENENNSRFPALKFYILQILDFTIETKV